MAADTARKTEIKAKAAHELQELFELFVYLAFFFCALTTYSALLLDKFHISYFNYGFALLNALVVAKVILIGEYMHVGKKHESKPLFYSSIYKAFLFGLLVFAFHVVEEIIKRLIHGESVAVASREMRIDDLLGHSLIVFSTFIPLFAFRELQRVMGEDYFRDLFFRTGAAAKPEPSSG
jgi:hypothetical protein